MPMWGDRERDLANILGVWPIYKPLYGTWQLHELYEDEELPPKWRPRQVKGPLGHAQGDVYKNRQDALDAAGRLNAEYARHLELRNIPAVQKTSLQLKVAKALTAKKRLMDEEEMMLAAAKSRATSTAPNLTDLRFQSGGRMRDEDIGLLQLDLLRQLEEMPYLKRALIKRSEYSRYGTNLLDDGTWSTPIRVNQKGALRFWRARISDGFGLDFGEHWGQTKAKIREMLLPDVTKLLLRQDVKEMLSAALAQGEKVLVCGGFVFWYEEDGDIGWQVKMTSAESSDEGRTIWHEGKIFSKNYGRIVVLPYIKESGEQVSGHTKNTAHEGPAMPRLQKNYLEIPFRELNGDLMIGLLGEIYRRDFVGNKK